MYVWIMGQLNTIKCQLSTCQAQDSSHRVESTVSPDSSVVNSDVHQSFIKEFSDS